MNGLKARGIFLAVFTALALGGCGGGGGGGGLNLSLPKVPIKLSYAPNELPALVNLPATVTGTTSADTIYVVILDPGGVFAPSYVYFYSNGGDEYVAQLQVSESVPVGVHKATLQVRICADAACRNVMTSASRPYEITVRPPTIDAFPDELISGALRDQPVRLSLSLDGSRQNLPIYVSAVDSAGRFTGAPRQMQWVDFTPGDYTVELPMRAGLQPQGYAGEVTLKFCGDPACASAYMTRTLPYQVQTFDVIQEGCCAYGMALDENQNLYLGNDTSIDMISSAGAISRVFTWNSGEDHPRPRAVAVDGDGYIWFSNDFAQGLDKIAPDGTISRVHHGSVGDMAFDRNGYRYDLHLQHQFITRYLPDGSSAPDWGAAALENPRGFAVNDEGVAYVADDRGVVRVDGTTTTFLPPLPILYGARDVEVAGEGSVLALGFVGGLYRITVAGAVETIVPKGTWLVGPEMEFSPNSIARAPSGKTYISTAAGLLVTQLP